MATLSSPPSALSGTHSAIHAQPLNLLISDETAMGCQLLRNTIVRSRLSCKVVTCAVSRTEIIDSMNDHRVDIALISENLEDGPLIGFQVLNDLRLSHP